MVRNNCVMNQTGVQQHVMPSPNPHNSIWDSILGADGKLYFSVCSELISSEYAKLAVYDTDTNTVKELFNTKELIFPNERMIRDSKFHTSFAWMNDGRLIMQTHTTDKAPDHPVWMPVPYYSNPWEGYFGSSLIIYNPRTDEAENLGVPVPRETLYGGAYDKVNNAYYALGFLKGHLYGFDLNNRCVRDYGQTVERASYRLVVGSDDNIYFTTRNGVLQRINVRTKEVENLRHQLHYTNEPGRLRPYLSYGVNGPDGRLYLTGMHDEYLNCYNMQTGEFSHIGRFINPELFSTDEKTNHYLGCMAFDKNNVLYYVVGFPRKNKMDDFKLPCALMRWDFLAGKDPEYLGIPGTKERVVTSSSSLLMDTGRDIMYIVGSNHANDGSDITAVRLSEYRACAATLGPETDDELLIKDNARYRAHGANTLEWLNVNEENPYLFSADAVIPIPLWTLFSDEEINESNVKSLSWEGDNLVVMCGCERQTRIILDINGAVLSRTDASVSGTAESCASGRRALVGSASGSGALVDCTSGSRQSDAVNNCGDVQKLPYYPGRQYKRKVTHSVRLANDRILVATEDGMLAVINGSSVFSLGPAWINGNVHDITITQDKSKVYGVAGDIDDIGVVFSYSDSEGVRWLGSVACDSNEFGCHSSPYLTAIALSSDDSILAVGAGGRMGCVYLYRGF